MNTACIICDFFFLRKETNESQQCVKIQGVKETCKPVFTTNKLTVITVIMLNDEMLVVCSDSGWCALYFHIRFIVLLKETLTQSSTD